MLTYADFYQILIEAEARRDDESLPRDVRDRSAETAALCGERMEREGLTRQKLIELASA
ncbi:hypothetical protein [Burkholderia anthina]|uniref:hypothetical protein n=1 Tax=Burkholderia anthina TaxID=179879 RepID=UPI0037BE3A71